MYTLTCPGSKTQIWPSRHTPHTGGGGCCRFPHPPPERSHLLPRVSHRGFLHPSALSNLNFYAELLITLSGPHRWISMIAAADGDRSTDLYPIVHTIYLSQLACNKAMKDH